jgi:hypothetical protein
MTAAIGVAAFFVGAAVSLAISWLLVSRLERVGERLGLPGAGLRSVSQAGGIPRSGRTIQLCRGQVRGSQLKERGSPAEGLPDGVTGQLGLVGPVPCHLPRLPARRQRSEVRLGHRSPPPGRDTAVISTGMALLRLDEIGGVEVISHLVAHEPQPRERFLRRPPPGGGLGFHGALVGMAVISHQGGVDDGDPPYCLADHRESLPTVQDPIPGQPLYGLAHRGDGPLQRTRLGLRVSSMLAVPRDPAARTAEPGMLTARREQRPALLTGPGIGHPAMLRTPWEHASMLMLGIPGAHASMTWRHRGGRAGRSRR